MMRSLTLIVGTCAFLSLMAQETPGTMHLRFSPVFHGKTLNLQDGSEKPAQEDIGTFRCYLSGFKLIAKGKVVWTETDSYHLLDAADPKSMEVDLAIPPKTAYDEVQFMLGIDSTTSVSGARGGDLDPTKGMYWAWNSGYINFKLEGHSPRSGARNGAFGFHMGGYLPPFATARTVTLERCGPGDRTITIDLDQFLVAVDLQTQHNVMSPGKAAFDLSTIAATIFHCENAR